MISGHMYVYQFIPFFYFNRIIELYEVVREVYTNVYEVANGAQIKGRALRAEDMLLFIQPLTTVDDWVDVYNISGRVRNIQRGIWLQRN